MGIMSSRVSTVIAVWALFMVTAGQGVQKVMAVESIGVNYGMLGGNLPSPAEASDLMAKHNIGKARIFQPTTEAIAAMAQRNVEVMVGTTNQEIQGLAASQEAADAWVQKNVKPYLSVVKYITVGNEVLPDISIGTYITPAMRNVFNSLVKAGISSVKVSTVHSFGVLSSPSFPPSTATFTPQVLPIMTSILSFIKETDSYVCFNAYPYFPLKDNPKDIAISYALGVQGSVGGVVDGPHTYSRLFDAMVDTFLTAVEAAGFRELPFMITETGWPSAGGSVATVSNAQTYNDNLIAHVLSNQGTPKRPGRPIPTYIFALFNENQKTGDETERHFGLFNPDMSPVYPLPSLRKTPRMLPNANGELIDEARGAWHKMLMKLQTLAFTTTILLLATLLALGFHHAKTP